MIGNLHLAAFDDGGRVRRAQLTALRDVAVAESENRHVVLGGDWNLRLAQTRVEFGHDPQTAADPPGHTASRRVTRSEGEQ